MGSRKVARESVIPMESVQVKQYRRTHDDNGGVILDSIKEVNTWDKIELNDDEQHKQNRNPNGIAAISVAANTVEFKSARNYYGLVIVFCSFMLNFIVDGITLTEGLLQEPILNAIKNCTECVQFEEPEFSWVNGFLTGVTLLVGPFSSLMVDRFGFRITVVVGTIIAALGILLSWAVSPSMPNIYALIVFYGIVAGIGFGLVFSASIVIVTHYFDKWRGLATGIVVCGTGGGTLSMAPVGHFLISNYGWNGAILIQSGIVLFCVVFGMFLVEPPTTEIPRKMSLAETELETSRSDRRHSTVISEIALTIPKRIVKSIKQFYPFFKSPTYLTLAVSGSLTMLGFFSPFAYMPDRAKSVVEHDWEKPLTLTCIGTANVLGRIIAGLIATFFPKANNLMISNVALTIAGITTAFSYLIESYLVLMIHCAVFGLCIGAFATLRSIIILEFIGLEKMNDGFGLSLTFMGFASLFSTPIFGILFEYSGKQFDIPFIAAGTFLALSGIICYPLRYIDRWEKSWNNNNNK